ncbi:MAG TPA: RNA polymerase subunit sigma [Planctomycetaceae bacterium]|nr:RNA polymerase subunit sigma [Planctomycetaceae bacterium]
MPELSSEDTESLENRVAAGDEWALDQLLSANRDKLRKLVQLRLPALLRHRVDESDVVQDTLLQAAKSISSFRFDSEQPFYVWLRRIALNEVADAHRKHLGAAKRDATREQTAGELSSFSLAQEIVSQSGSTPSRKAMRREMQALVLHCLDQMCDEDREVLFLRHFEQLSISEAAAVLGISKSGTAKRCLKALDRLRSRVAGCGVAKTDLA